MIYVYIYIYIYIHIYIYICFTRGPAFRAWAAAAAGRPGHPAPLVYIRCMFLLVYVMCVVLLCV